MHLRVASSDGGPRLRIPFGRPLQRTRSTLLVALTACWLQVACHRPARASHLRFEWTLTPAPATVGPAALTLRLFDADGRPVRGAQVRIEAQMAHPGMGAVVTTATEREHGMYHAEVQFTMSGDWILLVGGSLSNGQTLHYRIDVPGVRSA